MRFVEAYYISFWWFSIWYNTLIQKKNKSKLVHCVCQFCNSPQCPSLWSTWVGEFYFSFADISDAAIPREKTSIPHSDINYRMLLNKDGLAYLCGKRLLQL